MRGSFEKLMTIRYGSRSVTGPPGVTILSGVPCRKVEQREIEQRQFDFTFTEHWVTLDAVELTGPFTSSPYLGAIFTDQLAADEVMFDTEPGVWYTTCRPERVVPYGSAPYWRSLLLPLELVTSEFWPPPSSPPPPPSPPAPPLTPPGGSCGVGTSLPGLGDYTLGSNSGGFYGWYDFQVSVVGPIKISLPTPIDPDTRLEVAQIAVSQSCCSVTVWSDLRASGAHCVSFPQPMFGGGARRLCIRVQNISAAGPSSLHVKVEPGTC